jgi:hypothetical protein
MAGTHEFWFRRKYNLPPNDPRFLALTPEDIEAEYWAHRYYDNPTSESYDDPDFDPDEIEAELEAEAGVVDETLPDDFEEVE